MISDKRLLPFELVSPRNNGKFLSALNGFIFRNLIIVCLGIDLGEFILFMFYQLLESVSLLLISFEYINYMTIKPLVFVS